MSRGNDNIGDAGTTQSTRTLFVEERVRDLLDSLGIDWQQDPNMKDTPRRVAKMLVQETFSGRYDTMPKVTVFPNAKQNSSLDIVGPLTVRSTCSHHLMPVVGQAWVGIIHGESLLGLSKYRRLLDWIFQRPQIQEEAVKQYADLLEELLKPRALAVVVKAQHFCMIARGVKESRDAMFTTSEMRGLFLAEAALRAEFLSLIKV